MSTISAIEILCCPLTAVDATLLAHYKNLLSAEESQRLQNFRSENAAKEFLVARALLRTTLAERANCDALALRFENNADGKPALIHPSINYHFNLSHSHDWVVLAVTKGGEAIGIDIESYARRNNLSGIAQRFFSAQENAQLATLVDAEWIDYFFSIWTLKEAHAKALGCGLAKILACSSVAVDFSKRAIDYALSDIAATPHDIWSWLYRLDADCALAVVAHGNGFAQPRISRCIPTQSIEQIELEIRAHRVNAN